MASHESKNTPQEHLLAFYKTFEEIKDNKYDGLIITGAPVEKLSLKMLITGRDGKDFRMVKNSCI